MQENPAPSQSVPMTRRLGSLSVFAICTGAMFSSGFFLLPGIAADETGPSVPLAYLLAGLLVLPAIFSVAELSSAMPRAGGPYVFITCSLGPLAGTIGAFGKYLQLLLKGAFAFVGFGAYLSLLVDLPIRPVAMVLIAGFTVLNLMGVGHTARIEIALVALLLALLSYFATAGALQVVTEVDAPEQRFQPFLAFGLEGLLSAIALVFVSFGGVAQVAGVAEEVREPARSIPRGMLSALAVASFFYVAGSSAMLALVPPEALRDDPSPVATAAERFTVLPLPVGLVVAAALAAFASTGNAAILSAARYPLALARDGVLWSGFRKLSDADVPRSAVIVTGLALAVLVLAFDVESLAKLASAFLLLVFLAMCVAVLIFRTRHGDAYQPRFHSPLYPWMQATGIPVYTLLIWESGLAAVLFIAAICLAGGLWYRFGVARRAS